MPQFRPFYYFLVCLLLVLGLSGCKSGQNLIKNQINIDLPSAKNTVYQLKILPNSNLQIHSDNFNQINVTPIAGHQLILKFEYQTIVKKKLADANYREVLWIELPNRNQKLSETNLDNLNIWFARFCFCKDYVGYHKIKKGLLNFKLNKNELAIKMNFKWLILPQVVNFIDQKISLKP